MRAGRALSWLSETCLRFVHTHFPLYDYGRSAVRARVVGTTELQRVQSSTLDEWDGTERKLDMPLEFVI